VTEEWIQRWATRTSSGIILINFLFFSICVFARWPEWWVNVIYGKSALNWFTSVQLSWIGFSCVAIAALLELGQIKNNVTEKWIWLGLSVGFLYLSIEEHFRIHVRIREGLLKPHDIATHIPGIGPGDIVPICYALLGLTFVPFLLHYLRGNRRARGWLVVAVITGVIGVGMDARDYAGWSMTFYHKHKFVNELLTRTFSPMSFLIAFSQYFWDLVGQVLNVEA
jgi:hypothetical protein